MIGEYKIQVKCPSCKKGITVSANTTDGKCPECNKEIPALQLFARKSSKDGSNISTVKVIRAPATEKNTPSGKGELKNEKIKRKDIGPGAIVISNINKNQEYIVLSAKKKNGNKAFLCLPVIEADARTKSDRFVNTLEEGKLVVFNKEELIYDYNIKLAKYRVSEKVLVRIKQSYDKFISTSKPEEERERHNVVPHDGFRNGNAWEGLVTVPGHIKVFRG